MPGKFRIAARSAVSRAIRRKMASRVSFLPTITSMVAATLACWPTAGGPAGTSIGAAGAEGRRGRIGQGRGAQVRSGRRIHQGRGDHHGHRRGIPGGVPEDEYGAGRRGKGRHSRHQPFESPGYCERRPGLLLCTITFLAKRGRYTTATSCAVNEMARISHGRREATAAWNLRGTAMRRCPRPERGG